VLISLDSDKISGTALEPESKICDQALLENKQVEKPWFQQQTNRVVNDLPAIDFETELLFLSHVVNGPSTRFGYLKNFHLNYIGQEKNPKLMTTPPFIYGTL
jgi:hypothetical protein